MPFRQLLRALVALRRGPAAGTRSRHDPSPAPTPTVPLAACPTETRLLDALGQAVFALDRSDHLVYMNRAAEALTGWTLHEVRGRPGDEILLPAAGTEASASSDAVRQDGEPGAPGIESGQTARDYVVRRRDGHEIAAAATRSAVIGTDGSIEGFVIAAWDVTVQRQAEARLRENHEKLQQVRKLEAIGRLAGGVAHDFNNLLTGIRGFAQLGLEGLPENSPLRPDLEEIQRSADRAATLTRQLLAFGRRQVLQSRVLDLNALVLNTDRLLRRLIGEDIRTVLRLQAGLACVRADAGQIEQVLVNLTLNARDAMPEGGDLIIETRDAVLTDEDAARQPFEVRPGPYVMLAVRDTGSGMDPDVLERVFEPFFTTKPAGQGSGLGMSTVYGIIKQSGGYIWVDSAPGDGTAARIYLPTADGIAKRVVVDETPARPARGSETVLLVEDDDTVRALTRRVLSRQGYRVLEARNGLEALRIAEPADTVIDLVISDLVMPELGGRQLVERLRAIRPTVPVLLMSGYTEDAAVRQGLTGARESFLAKPFSNDALANQVRALLDSGLN